MLCDKFWLNLGEVLYYFKNIHKQILIKFFKWMIYIPVTEMIILFLMNFIFSFIYSIFANQLKSEFIILISDYWILNLRLLILVLFTNLNLKQRLPILGLLTMVVLLKPILPILGLLRLIILLWPIWRWISILLLCNKRYFDCFENIFLLFLSDLLYKLLMLF